MNPTREQTARLAYLLWEYDSTRAAESNWLDAEGFLKRGEVSPDDPDPVTTLIESELL